MKIDNENIIGTTLKFQFHPYLEFDIEQLNNIAKEFESDFSESKIIKKREHTFNINIENRSNINSIIIDHIQGINLRDRKRNLKFKISRESLSAEIIGSGYDPIVNEAHKALRFLSSLNITAMITQSEVNYKYILTEEHHLFEILSNSIKQINAFPDTYMCDVNYILNYFYNENETATVNSNIDLSSNRIFLDVVIINKLITEPANTGEINKILKKLQDRKNDILNFA
jgi:hypothetical protein